MHKRQYNHLDYYACYMSCRSVFLGSTIFKQLGSRSTKSFSVGIFNYASLLCFASVQGRNYSCRCRFITSNSHSTSRLRYRSRYILSETTSNHGKTDLDLPSDVCRILVGLSFQFRLWIHEILLAVGSRSLWQIHRALDLIPNLQPVTSPASTRARDWSGDF